MSYRPITAEGQAALDAGLEDEIVARLDQGHAERLARFSIGQAAPAFAAAHPDAANRPEVIAAMGQVLDSEPMRYTQLAITDPAACLEIAYGKAAQSAPSAAAPSAVSVVTLFDGDSITHFEGRGNEARL